MEADRTNTAVPACPHCVAAARRVAELEARVKQLEAAIEQARRSGKRQAAPFSRGLPKADPKRPGRKAGEDYGTKAFRAVPPAVDEVHEAPLPSRCPQCGGDAIVQTHVDRQYQVEIPRRPIHRQFNVAVGRCACCRQRVRGRHPLQTSDAVGCCSSQIGPDAQAAVVVLNKEMGLSQGKISGLFQGLFGIKLSRGASCQIMLRAATRCRETYRAIAARVRQSPSIVPDETGWRVGGELAWLHVAVGEDATAYLITRERGIEASALLIGQRYAGKLTHDGWASYDRFHLAIHQTCLTHLLRRCHELLETAAGGAAIVPRKIKALLQEALQTRDERDDNQITFAMSADRADELQGRLVKLATPEKIHAGNGRFCRHLLKHQGQLFNFLRYPGIDAANHRAERAIRPAVVNRKVWGGNRTQSGAAAQSILMSVLFTAARLKADGMQFISQTLCSPPGHPPLLLPNTG